MGGFHDFSDIGLVQSAEQPQNASAERDKGLVADAWALVQRNVVAPALNRGAIEPLNAVAQTVGVHIPEMETDKADFLSPKWLTQNVVGGVAMIVPYALSAKGMSGALRFAGSTMKVTGFTATALRNYEVASVAGAMAYDGLRVPHAGESRLGNALGGGTGFLIFGRGNHLLRNATSGEKILGRGVVGFLGAEAQHTVAAGQLPQSKEEFWQIGISGAVMNNALPMAHERLNKAVTELQANTRWGAPADLYMQTRKLSGDPELGQAIDNSPWARIRHADEAGFSNRGNGVVEVNSANATPEVIGKELVHIQQAKTLAGEQGFKAAEQALQNGDINGAWQHYRNTRHLLETSAQDWQNRLSGRVNNMQPLDVNNLALEIGAWPAPGGVSNEYRWRQEFTQFANGTNKTYRPGDKFQSQQPYVPAEQQNRRQPVTEEERISFEQREVGTGLVKDLQAKGFIAVFAGGSVRDQYRGTLPKDFDIATSAPPDVVVALFRNKGYTVVEQGKAFGVVNVVIEGKSYEIATLRNDGQYSDGRRPDSVAFVSSLYEDAARRDLRFNAMFEEPTTGVIYDFFGGKRDLQNGEINTVGDPNKRFAEDKLRMMRIPRFASRFGFTVSPEAFEAMQHHAPDITTVSGERIREELRGILTSKQPSVGLQMMMDTGLMQHTLPEVAATATPKGMQDPVHHPEGSTWTHTKMVVDNLAGGSFARMMGGLLHDIGKPLTQEITPEGRIHNLLHAEVGAKMVDGISQRLHLGRKGVMSDTNIITAMVEHHMKMHAVGEMRPGTLKQLLESPYIEDLVALQHADATGTGRTDGPSRSRREFIEQKRAEFAQADAAQQLGAKPIIDGKLLIQLGVKPGERLGQIKTAAQEAQREGAFTTPETAMEWLRANIPELKNS